MRDGARLHIVLLDDEQSVLRALSLLLEALGYDPLGFHVPSEALEYLESDSAKDVDLVLCDLRMPDINGFEVLSRLSTSSLKAPRVLISAHAGEEDVAKAKSLGAYGFLSKPFTPDELAELIRELKDNQLIAAA